MDTASPGTTASGRRPLGLGYSGGTYLNPVTGALGARQDYPSYEPDPGNDYYLVMDPQLRNGWQNLGDEPLRADGARTRWSRTAATLRSSVPTGLPSGTSVCRWRLRSPAATLPTNYFIAQRIIGANASVYKDFTIKERFKAQIRADLLNPFKWFNWSAHEHHDGPDQPGYLRNHHQRLRGFHGRRPRGDPAFVSREVLGVARFRRAHGAAVVIGIVLALTALTVSEPDCAECHRALSDSFAKTGMARSFRAARRPPDFNEPGVGLFRPVERGGIATILRVASGDVPAREVAVDYAVGSGDHGITYLHRTRDNKLIELPISWYAEQGGHWGMSPGYDRPNHPGFSRPVTYRCMFCHNAYPAIPKGYASVEGAMVFPTELPGGIDCQRCQAQASRTPRPFGNGNPRLRFAPPSSIPRALLRSSGWMCACNAISKPRARICPGRS